MKFIIAKTFTKYRKIDFTFSKQLPIFLLLGFFCVFRFSFFTYAAKLYKIFVNVRKYEIHANFCRFYAHLEFYVKNCQKYNENAEKCTKIDFLKWQIFKNLVIFNAKWHFVIHYLFFTLRVWNIAVRFFFRKNFNAAFAAKITKL